jgi:hypothetical protein
MTVGESFTIRIDGRTKTQTFRIFYEPSVTGGSFVIQDRAGLKIGEHVLGHEDIAYCTWVLVSERVVGQGRTSTRETDIRIMRHPAVSVTPLDFGQMPKLMTTTEFAKASATFTPKSEIYRQLITRYATEEEYADMLELLEKLPEADDISNRLTKEALNSMAHDFSQSNISTALPRGASSNARLAKRNFIHPSDMHMFQGEGVSAATTLEKLALL